MKSGSTVDAPLPCADLHQIDAICDRFEADWRIAGGPIWRRTWLKLRLEARLRCFETF